MWGRHNSNGAPMPFSREKQKQRSRCTRGHRRIQATKETREWREEMSAPEGSSSLLVATYFSEVTMSFQWIVSLCCCSVAQLCLTLCNPMNCSMPGFSVSHYLPEFPQSHVHWVNDIIQPSHPLLSPSPPVLKLSSIRVFSSELALHIRWPKDWSFSISPSIENSGLILFTNDWFNLLVVLLCIYLMISYIEHPVVQSLSRVQLFATPWTAARQASLSFTIFTICVLLYTYPYGELMNLHW